MQEYSIFIGYDARENIEFAVARDSIKRHLTLPIQIYGLNLSDLRKAGLYTRPTEMRPSAADRPVMWDVISNAAMSTEHANARFLVPHLAKTGWAMFCDGDVLCRGNIGHLFHSLDRAKAIYCVKHQYQPETRTKMDGQVQSMYSRKNWSSVVVFNCDHPSNKKLTLEMVNTLPGRDLHAFCWLEDEEIGELGPEWNFLVGHSDPSIDPKIVHFTSGTPLMCGYENCDYAEEWRTYRDNWIRGTLSFGC